MPTEKPRYTVIVDEDLLKEIDDFRFDNRYPSRSAATLDLIKLGIEVLKQQQATETANQSIRSRVFSSVKKQRSEDDSEAHA